MKHLSSKQLKYIMPWLVMFSILLIWEIFVRAFSIRLFILPPPTMIWSTLLDYHESIIEHALFTLTNTLLGFCLGVIIGSFLGIIIASWQMLYAGFYPILVGINSIPKAAIVPILVLWMGIGQPPAITTAFLLCFFPITVNIATGLITTEPELEDVLRSLGASKFDILMKVGIPRSLPYFFASLKIAITLAFVGAVISETIASNEGIGYLMLQAASQFRTSLMFAGLFVIACMCVCTYLLFAHLEKHFTKWSVRKDVIMTGG
jgi:NitT/TauT family transport system permease protein